MLNHPNCERIAVSGAHRPEFVHMMLIARKQQQQSSQRLDDEIMLLEYDFAALEVAVEIVDGTDNPLGRVIGFPLATRPLSAIVGMPGMPPAGPKPSQQDRLGT